MFLTHVVLLILWVVYGVLHSFFASLSVKRFFQKKLGKAYKHYRLLYTFFAFVSLASLVWFQLRIKTIYVVQPNVFLQAAGGIISIVGLGLMLFCIRKYFMSLSGLRSLTQEHPPTELIISSVHKYVRHPLYLGTFLFLWGLLFIFPLLSLAIAVSVITIYTLIGIELEEKKLVMDFGENYREYQKQVPKIIPKFY